MHAMKGEEEVRNIGSEYETEEQNCEDIVAETDDRNGEQDECWNWIKASDFKEETVKKKKPFIAFFLMLIFLHMFEVRL